LALDHSKLTKNCRKIQNDLKQKDYLNKIVVLVTHGDIDVSLWHGMMFSSLCQNLISPFPSQKRPAAKKKTKYAESDDDDDDSDFELE
jgi:hypothetical protein